MQIGGKPFYSLRRLDNLLAFGAAESMSDFDGENVRSDQLVNLLAKIIAKPNGPRRQTLRQNPFQRHGCIKNVFHTSSRPWRMRSTDTSRVPTSFRVSSRIRSISRQAF